MERIVLTNGGLHGVGRRKWDMILSYTYLDGKVVRRSMFDDAPSHSVSLGPVRHFFHGFQRLTLFITSA